MTLVLLLRSQAVQSVDSSGWGIHKTGEPVSRAELRAVSIGPRVEVLHDSNYETAWGSRLSTDPNDRQYDKANGGVATAVKDPDNAAIAAWRNRYSNHIP